MKVADLPTDESARLADLHSYHVLDTLPEREYDDLIALAAHCDHDNSWIRMEEYVEKNSDARFSHGTCPECLAKLKAERA